MKALLVVLLAVSGFASVVPCTDGEIYCDGSTKKVCNANGEWETFATNCNCLYPYGVNGWEMCDRANKIQCQLGVWNVVGTCDCYNPAGVYGDVRCVGAAHQTCRGGKWVTTGPSTCQEDGLTHPYGAMLCKESGKYLCSACSWELISTTCISELTP
eukprot:TRINITY_DN10190_c0_g1_i1.p1 TRINITY_DN10190_c0_g1~~TRINITY_DN10190_c0_g1_i1.p1  ORF type:complete len:157 (+),score=20.65 TRINITY_DN10190_c0_g1_i1:65-535(+)